MAESALFQNYLSCPICSSTFRDPVSLSCSHNFCSTCLQKYWFEARNRNCPICKKDTSAEQLSINFTLKELADSFTGKQQAQPSLWQKPKETFFKVCNVHSEDPKWFCKDEQRAVCHICEFGLHQNHKVVPVEQAIWDVKEQLKSNLKMLQDKRTKNQLVEKSFCEIAEYLKKQSLSTESQIRSEFEQLHHFLREEEETRLAALREEESQKWNALVREIKRIQDQIANLSESICAVEEELQKDNVPFLSSYKATQSRARTYFSLPDPKQVTGALIDVAKHLGNLSFRVWDKMKEKVRFTPIILDPNTANPNLYLSNDLTAVRCGDTLQQLPDNPERNMKYSNVFGYKGFNSGKHSWEVEVGDHPDWLIGLVKESFDRKGETFASPKYGVLSLVHRNNKYTNGAGKTVTVRKNLRRFKVMLDYGSGEVSFYNSEDKSLICTHKDTFSERVFPYFCIGKAGPRSEVRICEVAL